jgi:[NiFe] hydrogenase assembly HybE family chaperone
MSGSGLAALSPAAAAPLGGRVAALVRQFQHIQATRMAGVPLLHPALAVQAVGFAPEPGQPGLALGVLVTPWFMNLIRLPLADSAAALLPEPGCDGLLQLGAQQLDFIGAQEDVIGRYALCSLFSPMADFADQAGAVATALAVLDLLRPTAATSASPGTGGAPQQPARRGFLFGRAAGTGAA